MKNTRIILFSILFLSTLIFCGSKWTDASRFSSALACAPVIEGQNIFALTKNGMIYSVNQNDGSSRIAYSLNSSTHVRMHIENSIIYAGTDNGEIFAISAKDFSTIWKYPQAQEKDKNENKSTKLKDLEYKNLVLYAVFEDRFVAISQSNGATMFEKKLNDGVCARADNSMIFVHYSDKVSAYTKEGFQKWTITSGEMYGACPTPIDSNVYIPTTQGRIIAVNAQTSKIEWTYQTQGWVVSDPLKIGKDIIFAGTDANAISVDSLDAKENFKVKLSGSVNTNPIVVQKDSRQIIIFGTRSKSIIGIDAQTAQILFDYQISDWVEHIVASKTDPSTIFVSSKDGTLWAISISPICTIDYPRTNDIIPQDLSLQARAFSFSELKTANIIVNSKPYQSVQLSSKNAEFEIDLDLGAEALSIANVQCIATDINGQSEIDRLNYKTQPIISASAKREKLEVLIYPKNLKQGQKFSIYVRDENGAELDDVALEINGQNMKISSPQEFEAESNEYNIIAKKAGYYPAQIKFTTTTDLGLLPYLVAFILLAISIGGTWIYFSKKEILTKK